MKKSISKRLNLNKESLRLLDPLHLSSLNGGATTTTTTIFVTCLCTLSKKPPC